MAEIKDVYSLEFNGSQFQSELDSAIAKVNELNAAMEEGADVSADLEDAQNNLVSVLGVEANGVEQLNQKRDALVKTQKRVNAESKAGIAVNNQLNTTNKQIAVSTGQAAVQQRGFGQALVAGTRQISSMRRVVTTLAFSFRALTSAIPFGFILAYAGPILEFFSSLLFATDNTADNMDKINDATLDYKDRIGLAEVELRKLQNIENERGYLTEEEQKRRRELVKTYEETSKEMLKVEQDRIDAIADYQYKAQKIGIKLRGETVQAVIDNRELERKEIDRQGEITRALIKEKETKAYEEAKKAELEGDDTKYRQKMKLVMLYIDEWSANLSLQTKEIEQVEADAQKRINDLNAKALREQQDKLKQDKANRLKAIEDEIRQIEKLNKFRIAQTEEGTKERYQTELNAINLLEDAYKKYANELGMDLLDLELMFIDNAKLRSDIDEKRLQDLEKIKEAELKALHEMQKAYENDLQNYRNSLDAASDYRVNNAETNLNMQLLELEKERNQKLLMAYGNVEQQEKIDNEYNKKRKELEVKINQEIIKIRLEFLKKLRDASESDPAAIASLNKQISELELKYQELNNVISETAEVSGKTVKDLQELIDQTSQLIQGVSDSVFSVLNAQVQAYIQGLDKAIDKSKSALDEIRSNSEDYNARQLEIEKERLDRLESERARAVEREKNLAQVQIAINAAIAVSKAAVEGAGFASAVTISLTLASLIAGLAQARVAAGNAFYEGVEFLERGNNKPGRDTIPAMLNEGERVITTDTNSKYWDVLTAVHNNRIPADVLNTFAKAYQQGGIKNALGAFGDNVSLSSELGQKSIFVNVAQTYGGLENRLERIEAVLTELPKYMPRTTVTANANGIFRIVEQRQARKNFSRNWSK